MDQKTKGPKDRPTTRRSFLKTTGLSATAVALAPSIGAAKANDKIIIGATGMGGRGRKHAKLLAGRDDVDLAYVCDPDLKRAELAAKEVEEAGGKKPKVVQDLRRILEDSEVDAITVATPDHWHAPATILACDAGKHVYVEKPCSHNIREGRLMIEAARRHDRVVQVGTQSRNSVHVRRAIELIREGAIGDVLVAKAWDSQKRKDIGHGKASDPPAHLDYDLWLGPAPHVPYYENRLHYNWHWRHTFGTGDMGNDGVHDLDLALWGLGVESHPESVSALGSKLFFDDDQEFPDTQHVAFEYAPEGKNGRRKQLVFELRIWSPYDLEGYSNGNAFYGTDGFLLLGKNDNFRLYGKDNELIEEMDADGSNTANTLAHHADFIDCIRNGGKRPQADIEIGHRAATLCHLGNLATRLRRNLFFDDKKEKFINDPDANTHLTRTYRNNHWASLD